MLHSQTTTSRDDTDWPQTAEEAATQMRAVLEMLSRLAVGVGLNSTSEMLLHTADLAEDEAFGANGRRGRA